MSTYDVIAPQRKKIRMSKNDDEEKSYHNLQEDVKIEILSWLPPETLLEFKTVCRSWYSIINNVAFIAKHKSHFENNGRILITTIDHDTFAKQKSYLQNKSHIWITVDEERALSSVYLNFRLFQERSPFHSKTMNLTIPHPNCYGRYDMIGSCHGLFCYGIWLQDAPIQLCNIYTSWTYLVPPYDLAWTRARLDFCYGVGFDKYSNDYKVIKFINGDRQAAIWSVKNKSWKHIIVSAPGGVAYRSRFSVFLDGFIHWLGYKGDGLDNKENRLIMSFDVCNEVFREIQLPKIGNSHKKNAMSIHVVKGSPSLLAEEYRDDDNDPICHVWAMKEYGVSESWSKQYRVVLGQGMIRGSIMAGIKLTVGGKILFSSYDGRSQSQEIYLYDPETGVYTNFDRGGGCSDLNCLVSDI